MKLTKVKRVLHRRLAYLAALIEKEPDREWARDEHDALETILRCQGMLDVERLATNTHACTTRVMPAVVRQHERARRGSELAGLAEGLVVGLQRAARVA